MVQRAGALVSRRQSARTPALGADPGPRRPSSAAGVFTDGTAPGSDPRPARGAGRREYAAACGGPGGGGRGGRHQAAADPGRGCARGAGGADRYQRRWRVEVTLEERRARLGVETQRQWSRPLDEAMLWRVLAETGTGSK